VGNTVSLKSCKIAGPVAVANGGLLLLFITVLESLRQDKLVITGLNTSSPVERSLTAATSHISPASVVLEY